MSTPVSALGGLLWPSTATQQPVEPARSGDFGRELSPHRRLFAQFEALRGAIDDAVALTADLLRHGGQLLLLGHGSSQQVAALLAGEINRRSGRWTGIARQRATPFTAEQGATRFIEATGRAGDVALWLAGHGDGAPLLRAVSMAHRLGMANVAIVGAGGGAVRTRTDVCLAVAEDNPMRVHEAQLFLGHALVRQIDAALRPALQAV